jgi:hypothetical protein
MPPMTVTELVTKDAGAYQRLCGHFGPELVARLLDLERDLGALLERELPDADAEQRAWHAALLAHAVVADAPWFATTTQERPTKVAKALRKVDKAARDLLKALDDLPPAGHFGMHMRLLLLDMPPAAMRRAVSLELVYRTSGKGDAGLNRRKAAVAEIALAAMQTHDGAPLHEGKSRPDPLGYKPRAEMLTRCVADAYEALTGQLPPVSGSAEGPYYRVVAAVLKVVGLRHDSAPDVALREARRRRAAAHSGDNGA